MHHNDNLPDSGPTDATTLAKLRFLADVAIDTLGAIEAKALVHDDSAFHIVPETASEDTLRVLLRLAVPVLVDAGHWELADQIKKVLRERA